MVSLRYQLNQFKENVRIIIKKAYLSNTTVIDISQRLAYKMAAKNGWHRYQTKLRHCHPIYIQGGSKKVSCCTMIDIS